MQTKHVIDVRDEILAHLEEIKRPLAWITDSNTGIPYSAIYAIFKQKTYGLSQDNLDIINGFLNTNFEINGTPKG